MGREREMGMGVGHMGHRRHARKGKLSAAMAELIHHALHPTSSNPPGSTQTCPSQRGGAIPSRPIRNNSVAGHISTAAPYRPGKFRNGGLR